MSDSGRCGQCGLGPPWVLEVQGSRQVLQESAGIWGPGSYALALLSLLWGWDPQARLRWEVGGWKSDPNLHMVGMGVIDSCYKRETG